MSEETKQPAEPVEENKQYQDPQVFLKTIPDAPSQEQIKAWKLEVPGGRVRLFTPDGRRVFLLRALSGIELAELTKKVPPNASNPEEEMKVLVAARCTLWTNLTHNHLLDEISLRQGTAGLPETLYLIVSELSDYFDPIRLQTFSADL